MGVRRQKLHDTKLLISFLLLRRSNSAMSEMHSTVSSDTSARITPEIVPVEEEEDDVDTLAAVGQVQADVQREVAHLDGYTVSPLPVSEPEQAARGSDIILLITVIGASLTAYKDLLTSLFQT